ncbi:MAG: hypothetical protein OHK0037_24840 [Elainellaceae cyanobacterium]
MPALLAQFRAAYPAASLIADLLTVQNGRYVVRVSVVMGGLTLATGLAESASIEEAEDRARGRSLQALGPHGFGLNAGATASAQATGQVIEQPGEQPSGQMGEQPSGQMGGQAAGFNIGPTPEAIAPPPPPMDAGNHSPNVFPSDSLPGDSTVSAMPSIALAGDLTTEAATLPTESDWDKPDPTDPPLPPEDELDPGPVVADFYAHIAASDEGFPEDSEPIDLSKITKPASQISAKPSRKKSTSSSPAPEPAPPDPAPAAIDFSDILAETDVELRRLGWDAKRGREHLKANYSKRSRQELNETELYDFLDYLKAQPTP